MARENEIEIIEQPTDLEVGNEGERPLGTTAAVHEPTPRRFPPRCQHGKDGARCRWPARKGGRFCSAHETDPDYRARKREIAAANLKRAREAKHHRACGDFLSKGGILAKLAWVCNRVERGKLAPSVASVIVSICRAALDVIRSSKGTEEEEPTTFKVTYKERVDGAT
jgi:hypothetical protein